MQPYQKLVASGLLLCIGLVNLLLPQYVMALTSWWQTFREDNLQPDVEEMVDDALGIQRRDMTEMGYRIVGGMLIALAIVLWFATP